MDEFLNDFERSGWAVQTHSLADADAGNLRQECATAHAHGAFHRAKVGRGDSLKIREEIRGDEVMWLEPGGPESHQGSYLAQLELLRLALNQRFFLGLFRYEGHFAIYPIGGFYTAHLDRHAGTLDRIVTVILYLNDDWQPGDGGELKIYTSPQGRDGAFVLVEPRLGTMVCFMAAEFWHEVLPAKKQRMSITGWFRQS